MARCSRVTFLALALLTGAAAFVVALFFKFGTFAEWLDQESCIAWHWLRSGSPYSLWFHERFLQPLESERDRLLVVYGVYLVCFALVPAVFIVIFGTVNWVSETNSSREQEKEDDVE